MFSINPPPILLDPPMIFGPLRAAFVDPDFAALGPSGILYYQFDVESDRLRQALFEWRDAAASKVQSDKLLVRLQESLGAPRLTCIRRGPAASSRVVAARWESAGLMLHVSMLDHRADGVARYDLNSDPDPRRPSHERLRVTRRSLPRRLVARLHDADDIELIPRRACPDGAVPETR